MSTSLEEPSVHLWSDAKRRSRAVTVLCVISALTPMQTQSYSVALPVLLVHELDQPASTMGLLLLVMAFFTVVGIVALQRPMLAKRPLASYLNVTFAIRGVASLLHFVALAVLPIDGNTIPLLFVSRVIHGLSLGAVAACQAWCACTLAQRRAQQRAHPSPYADR